ncbi:hypothetical protein C8F01DRAFT_1130349 [Mycena amicta]|nr:hypothetical protein C8F01DRAFT_1130349 [Mycena amicta]
MHGLQTPATRTGAIAAWVPVGLRASKKVGKDAKALGGSRRGTHRFFFTGSRTRSADDMTTMMYKMSAIQKAMTPPACAKTPPPTHCPHRSPTFLQDPHRPLHTPTLSNPLRKRRPRFPPAPMRGPGFGAPHRHSTPSLHQSPTPPAQSSASRRHSTSTLPRLAGHASAPSRGRSRALRLLPIPTLRRRRPRDDCPCRHHRWICGHYSADWGSARAGME